MAETSTASHGIYNKQPETSHGTAVHAKACVETAALEKENFSLQKDRPVGTLNGSLYMEAQHRDSNTRLHLHINTDRLLNALSRGIQACQYVRVR